jgi:hypothetical protein
MRILGWFKMIFRQNKPLQQGGLSLEYFDEREITKEKFRDLAAAGQSDPVAIAEACKPSF